MEAAMSMCSGVSFSLGFRAGTPNSASNLPFVMVSPVQ